MRGRSWASGHIPGPLEFAGGTRPQVDSCQAPLAPSRPLREGEKTYAWIASSGTSPRIMMRPSPGFFVSVASNDLASLYSLLQHFAELTMLHAKGFREEEVEIKFKEATKNCGRMPHPIPDARSGLASRDHLCGKRMRVGSG